MKNEINQKRKKKMIKRLVEYSSFSWFSSQKVKAIKKPKKKRIITKYEEQRKKLYKSLNESEFIKYKFRLLDDKA